MPSTSAVRVPIVGEDKTARAIRSARNNLKGLGATAKAALGAFGMVGGLYATGRLIKNIASVNMQFEQASREVNSLLNLSANGFARMQDDIRGVASSIGVDLVTATKAAYQAVSAGVKRENLVEFLSVASKAGIAGLADTETAVNTLTSVLNAYKESNLTASKASDILFSAVKDGKTTFTDLAASMYIAAPIAASTGVSFEELAAATASITKVTNNTGVAMTQIKGALVALIKPSADMEKLFAGIGVASGESLIEMHGFGGALDAIRAEAERSGVSLTKAFGRIEGYNALLNLTGDSARGFADTYANAMNSAGLATAAFNENNQTTVRSVEKLKGSWQSMVTAFGESDAIKAGLDGIAGAFRRISDESLPFWDALVNGKNPYSAAAEDALAARKEKQTPAMKAALKAQENLDTARKNGALPDTLKLLQFELDFRKQIVQEEQKQLTVASKRAEKEKTQLDLIKKKENLQKQEGAELIAHIKGLNSTKYAGSSAVDMAFDEMLGLTKRGGTQSSAATPTLESLGLGFGASSSGTSPAGTGSMNAAPDPFSAKAGHVYSNFMAQKALGSSGNSDSMQGAVTALNKGGTALEKISAAILTFVKRLETAEQQIANAR